MFLRWVRAKDLDCIVYELEKRDIEASRHAYSYRLLYKGMIVAGVHVYPGFNEASVRLYKIVHDLAEEASSKITESIKKCFPDYKIIIKWYPPRSSF